jgi:hypothetical protein
MITIFCYFSQNQCNDQMFAKTSSILNKKRQIFPQFFLQKYFKNLNIGSRSYPLTPAILAGFSYEGGAELVRTPAPPAEAAEAAEAALVEKAVKAEVRTLDSETILYSVCYFA